MEFEAKSLGCGMSCRVWMVIIVFVAPAEANAGVSVTHSMNVQGVSLEVYHTHQHVGTTRVAALEPGLKVGESKMGLHVLLQHILSRNTAHPPFICKLFIPYADKAHWMREHKWEQLLRWYLQEVAAL
jgi:hypothetical protein